jgi:hypothetical protein
MSAERPLRRRSFPLGGERGHEQSVGLFAKGAV